MSTTRPSEQPAITYRIERPVPWIGYVGLLFSAYLLGYAMRLTDVDLFVNLSRLRDDYVGWALPLILISGSVFLILLGRVSVTITPSGITYRGVLRTKGLRWSEVDKVIQRPHRGNLDIHSHNSRITIFPYIQNVADLKKRIVESVERVSPGLCA